MDFRSAILAAAARHERPAGRVPRGAPCIPCDEKRRAAALRLAREARAKRDAKAYTGRIVYIIPARNEGPWVRRTIRSLRRQKAPGTDMRFFVVDDGSTDGSCKGLDEAKDTTVVRNEQPIGQGRARSLGVYANPDADAYISIDAHEELDTPFGAEIMALAAAETGGVIGCLARRLESKSNSCGAGARWVCQVLPLKTDSSRRKAFLKTSWFGKNGQVMAPVDLHGGAFYAFTRDTFERLGGFAESEGRHGFFERGLAVQAKFRGVPLLVHTGVSVRHLYRTKKTGPKAGYKRGWADVWYSYIECFRSMFRPDIWERVFRSALDDVRQDATMRYLLSAHKLAARQVAFEPTKLVSDEEVVRWMGLGALLEDPEPLSSLGSDFQVAASRLPDAPSVMIVGEDNGDLARRVLELRPRAQIVLVEPDPQNFAAMEADAPAGVRCVHAALSRIDGPATLHRRTRTTAHSLYRVPRGTNKAAAGDVVVPGRQLKSLLVELKWQRLDLLLLNCEGGELFTCREIANDPTLPSMVRQICASFHSRPNVSLYPEAKREAALNSLRPRYDVQTLSAATELYLLTAAEAAP